MMRSKKESNKKKQFTILAILIFSILLPVYSIQFLLIFGENIVSQANDYTLIVLFSTLFMSIGLLLKFKIMRLSALLIIYLSMFLFIAKHIEHSMIVTEYYKANKIIKEYSINYAQLIYPEVILQFISVLFAIVFIALLFIYTFCNEETLKLYNVSKKSRLKEFYFLLVTSITITIVYIYLLIQPKIVSQKKAYIQPEHNAVLNTYKLPKSKPLLITSPTFLETQKTQTITYKIMFEGNVSDHNCIKKDYNKSSTYK